MSVDPSLRSSPEPLDPGLTGGEIEPGESPPDATAAGQTTAIGPWKLAGRRLRRNKVALIFLALFLVLVILCLLAPVYSHDIAHVGPNVGNSTGTVKVGGKTENILSLSGLPIGPTWGSR